MRWVTAATALCFLGGVASTIVFLFGVESAAAIAFLLGSFALAGALPVVMGPLDTAGLPNHEEWPWRKTNHRF